MSTDKLGALCETMDIEPERDRPVDYPFMRDDIGDSPWWYVTDATGEKLIACQNEEHAQFVAAAIVAVPGLLDEVTRLRADVAAKMWSCPDCAFTFAAYHHNADGSMSCPVCEVQRLATDLRSAQAERDEAYRDGDRLAQQLDGAREDCKQMQGDLDDARSERCGHGDYP